MKIRAAFLVFYLTLIFSPIVSVEAANNQCVNDANDLGKQCITACVDQKKTDKIACVVPDNECGANCGTIFLSCIAPIDIARDVCIDQCTADFESAQSACGTECGCTPGVDCGSDSCYFSCLNDPLRVRGGCRVDCALSGRPARKACRIALKKCARNC